MIKKLTLTYLILALAILFSGGLFIYFYRPTVQPVINANTNVNLNQPSTAEIIPPTKTDCTDELDTACWNTYRNTEYGFEFKYPREWKALLDNQENYRGTLYKENLPPANGDYLRFWAFQRDKDFIPNQEYIDKTLDYYRQRPDMVEKVISMDLIDINGWPALLSIGTAIDSQCSLQVRVFFPQFEISFSLDGVEQSNCLRSENEFKVIIKTVNFDKN